MLAAFWLLIVFYRRETYQHAREMAFFGALFSLVLLLTAGLYAVFPGRPELVPIPFAIIVITLLYNGRIGVTAALILAMLLDGQWALREQRHPLLRRGGRRGRGGGDPGGAAAAASLPDDRDARRWRECWPRSPSA